MQVQKGNFLEGQRPQDKSQSRNDGRLQDKSQLKNKDIC